MHCSPQWQVRAPRPSNQSQVTERELQFPNECLYIYDPRVCLAYGTRQMPTTIQTCSTFAIRHVFAIAGSGTSRGTTRAARVPASGVDAVLQGPMKS